MNKKRLSVEQITAVLKQAETGCTVSDLCRQVGISEQTVYRWKKTHVRTLPGEARELKIPAASPLSSFGISPPGR